MEKERRCTKERKTRKIIFSLPHNIASKLWTDYSLGKRLVMKIKMNRRGRRWQAGLAEEREAHTPPLFMD